MQVWISGSEKQSTWTQCLPGGRKYRFQNPIGRNYFYVRELERFLGVSREVFYSIGMFIGESTIMTEMPPHVLD